MTDDASSEFKDRIALVTGASKGIGRACVQTLASKGAKVFFTYRNEDKSVRNLLAWGEASGASVFGLLADATDPDSYGRVRSCLIERAESRLDILVNNVGDPIRRSTFLESGADLWRQCFDLNVHTAVRATLTFLPLMMQSGAAVVVNVSSIAGTTTGAGDSLHYGAAKAALDTFTVGLAREMKGHPVRVVGVAPGIIDTSFHDRHSSPDRMQRLVEQTPLARAGTAEEVADVVAWLASDRSSYVSGAVVRITGGR